MSFDDLADVLNQSCLTTFGESLTYTHVSTGVSETITGILEGGVEPEDVAPGDGSTYALLFLESTGADPVPEPADEVSNSTTIYKVVRVHEDAGRGMSLLLRKDKDLV